MHQRLRAALRIATVLLIAHVAGRAYGQELPKSDQVKTD